MPELGGRTAGRPDRRCRVAKQGRWRWQRWERLGSFTAYYTDFLYYATEPGADAGVTARRGRRDRAVLGTPQVTRRDATIEPSIVCWRTSSSITVFSFVSTIYELTTKYVNAGSIEIRDGSSKEASTPDRSPRQGHIRGQKPGHWSRRAISRSISCFAVSAISTRSDVSAEHTWALGFNYARSRKPRCCST